MLNQIAIKFTNYLIKNGIGDKKKLDFYVYGIEVILEKVLSYSTILLLALHFRLLFSSLLFLIFFIALRGRTGGYHFQNDLVCFFSSIMMYIIGVYIFIPLFLSQRVSMLISLIISVILIILLAPINHPNVHLTKDELIKVRNDALVILFIEVILIIFMYFYVRDRVCFVFPIIGIIMCAILLVVAKILKQEVLNEERII